MIDTNLLKDNPQRVLKTLKSRNYDFNIESYESLEAQRKTHQTETEDLQAKRNSLSKEYVSILLLLTSLQIRKVLSAYRVPLHNKPRTTIAKSFFI